MTKQLRRLLTQAWLLILVLALPLAAPAGTLSTTYYNLDYGQWSGVANALVPSLDAAFTTPQALLNYSNQGHGKIDVHFYRDSGDDSYGYMNPGENALYLNVYGGSRVTASYLSDYGDTIAHETTHILYYNKTNLASRYNLDSPAMQVDIWVSECMAFYVGDFAYPQGPQETKASIGSQLSYYSKDNTRRATWYDSGVRYDDGTASDLDYVQLDAAGLFLATYGDGKGFARLSDYLSRDASNYDNAFQYAYGKPSGQYSTSAGANVNTLYSDYIKYYFGGY